MMGLLDYGSDITDDPRQLGLLSLGLRLMSTPGKFGQALGTAGQGALGDMQRAKQAAQEQQQAKLRDQMLRMQIQQSQAQQAQQAEALRQKEQFRQSLLADVPSPLGQANAVAAQAGPLGSKAAAAAQPQIDPMQVLMRRALETGQMDPMDFVKAQQKDATPIKLGAGEQLLAPGTFRQLASNPKDESNPETLKLLQALRSMAPNDPQRPQIQRRLDYLSTHGAGVTINTGDNAFAKAAGTTAVATLDAARAAAETAQMTLGNTKQIRAALLQGDVTLGPWADVRQAIMRGGQAIGAGSEASADKMARTRSVQQALARLELDAAALIKGQGQVTENERKIVSRAAAGQIENLSPKELHTLLTAIERNSNRTIEIHDLRAKQIPKAAGDLTPLLTAIPGAASTAPAEAPLTYNPQTGKWQ